MSESLIGKPIERVDGKLKVTGSARYSADFPMSRLAHAYLIESTITCGTIRSFDLTEAKKVKGFIGVLTHKDGIEFRKPKPDEKSGAKSGNGTWMPLQDAKVHYNGQMIAIALAESFEAAREIASLVRVSYEETAQNVLLEKAAGSRPEKFFGQELQFKKGDASSVLDSAGDDKIQAAYSTPIYHHNPMEPHATTAIWKNNQLEIYDATQGVSGSAKMLASLFGISDTQVKLISYFLGGGFGCKGFFWPHTALAAAAAKHLHRPVKLVLTRQQMFTSNGHRSRTIQEVSLAAEKNGKLKAIRHKTQMQTSQIAEFVEPCGFSTKMLYASPNIEVSHEIHKVDTGTPCPTRAPGEATGTFALECAMDELAYHLDMDPLKLRLANDTSDNPEDGKPFSSKFLKECYERGAEAFRWSKRQMKPGSMSGSTQDGKILVGWGMATATYPANRVAASASAKVIQDGAHGKFVVTAATQDIGTGTYTIMAQIAAEALDVPMEFVRFELGNSRFPEGPVSGGSQTSASVGSAVRAACLELKTKLDLLASQTGGKTPSEILSRAGRQELEVETHVEANTRKKEKPKVEGAPDPSRYAFHSFGAHFVEVRINPNTREIRLGKMLGVYDVGRILNAKTARNQCIGGMTWAAGMALMEETIFDPRYGRIVTRNLADYHVPVHADMPEVDVIFIDQPDTKIGPLGSRGLGEISITGMTAAIANAVFHATGKRVRDLPITIEKIL